MEPERKIEKLLRAFAKKRRADAGDSLKLHPATRRLLQGEAARRAPKAAGGNLFVRLFGRLGPGLIYATCFAVVVFMGAALLLPSFSKAKGRSQLAGAKNYSKADSPATPKYADKTSPPPPGSPTEIAGVDNSIPLALADTPARRELAEAPAAAPVVATTYSGGFGGAGGASGGSKIADQPASAVTLTGSDFEKSKTEADGADRKKLAAAETRAVGGAVAKAETAAGLRLDGLTTQTDALAGKLAVNETVISNGAIVTQKFAQQAGNNFNAQNLFKNAAAAARITPVLVNFQFQQNGSAVAVVDEDGSVYNGYLVADETKLQNGPADLNRAPTKLVMPAPKQTKDSQAYKNAEPPAQNYFFRVTGTNRSLQQNVVFTGNVLTFSNVVQASSQTVGSSFNRAGSGGGNISQVTDKNLYQQSLFSNSRIAGTAVVNSTNEIEINALPVGP